SAIENSACTGIAMLVVHDEDITERPVDDVEAHVRAPLLVVAVVLNERVQKHPRTESVVHARGQQILYYTAFDEVDVVVRVLKGCSQLVIDAESPSGKIRMFVARVKPARGKPPVCGEAAAHIRIPENEVDVKFVLT